MVNGNIFDFWISEKKTKLPERLVIAPYGLAFYLEFSAVRELIYCFFELHGFVGIIILVLSTKTKSPGVETSRVTSYLPCDRVSMPPFCKRAWQVNHTTKIILCEALSSHKKTLVVLIRSPCFNSLRFRGIRSLSGTDDIFRFVGAEGFDLAFSTTLMLSAKSSQAGTSG